jgi:LysR family transcriptional regulator, hydrogen peroxide-inducible genes activator
LRGDFKKHHILAQDIEPNKLWLLEEGHCFRSQIMNLCELQKSSKEGHLPEYEAGSMETLRRLVPMREVSLVVHRDFVKKGWLKY